MAVWEPPDYLKDIPPNINEFSLIKKYLSDIGASYATHVSTNVGDDCAVMNPTSKQLVTTDVAVAGVHFPKNLPAQFIAQRAVIAAFSDIAAMGGKLSAFTLGLSIEKINIDWMIGLRKGLQSVAKKYQVPLIGGDVVRGPTQLAVTVIGNAIKFPVLRNGAKQGDVICLSGKLGGSYLGFKAYQKDKKLSAVSYKYLCPKAKLDYGKYCAKYATSMIDISDGIFQDLAHLMHASKVGARLNFKSIPFLSYGDVQKIIGFGDDYELLFTVSQKNIKPLRKTLASKKMQLWEIGCVDGKKLKIDNLPKEISLQGWDHFA